MKSIRKQSAKEPPAAPASKAPSGGAIDTAVDVSRRPMVGRDIERFRARHGLHAVDVIYALCIQNSAKYNEVLRMPEMPHTLELLIRLYDQFPGHTPWLTVSPREAFDMLYSDVMRPFEGTEYAKEVRLALYRRFTAILGRSVFTAYRWIQSEGNSKSSVGKICAKLSVIPNPRGVIENLARLMYKVRGIDFEREYPLPTPESPPKPKRRGPPRRSDVEAAAVAKPARKAASSRARAST
jgi:hypothetical protein